SLTPGDYTACLEASMSGVYDGPRSILGVRWLIMSAHKQKIGSCEAGLGAIIHAMAAQPNVTGLESVKPSAMQAFEWSWLILTP
ncbi:MAG: hypothetical protein ACO3PR_16315, partial [Limisphaerales bacterium]